MSTTTAMPSIPQKTLLVAIELSNASWKLAFGEGSQVRHRQVPGGDYEGLFNVIEEFKGKLRLEDDAPVVACYEAGRDGFSLQRVLQKRGVVCLVVDPSSIEVERRARRAKSDRIDAMKLLGLLVRREIHGDARALRVINSPSVEQEDKRQLSRERERIVKDRTSKANEMKGLLFAQGVRYDVRANDSAHGLTMEDIERMQTGDGEPLPAHLKRRLGRIIETIAHLNAQLAAVCEERAVEIRSDKRAKGAASATVALMWINGVGMTTADALAREFFDWRNFRNGREVGSCAGLVPTPWSSGEIRQNPGISKAGNSRVRGMAIELAWRWLVHQPASDLTLWYRRRFADGGERQRRIGIVALARKILVALWRYLVDGALPVGVKRKERITIEST